jgi:hypothetical protein
MVWSIVTPSAQTPETLHTSNQIIQLFTSPTLISSHTATQQQSSTNVQLHSSSGHSRPANQSPRVVAVVLQSCQLVEEQKALLHVEGIEYWH